MVGFFAKIYGGIIRPAFKLMGFELQRSGIKADFAMRVARLLNDRAVEVLLDVGANTGQFAQSMFKNGFNGRIISFDPLPDAHQKLTQNANSSGRAWAVPPAIAIDDQIGVARFVVAANSASSSLLDQSSRLKEVAPVAEAIGEIEVPTDTLDHACESLVNDRENVALKIDTQGAELRVLRGGRAMLARVDVIIIELSLAQLYEGQPDYSELDLYLREAGFILLDLDPTVRDPRTGLLAECDAVYARSVIV